MAELITPSRLPSLGPRAITILSHLDEQRIVELDKTKFTHIYPFETLFSLKQRIANIIQNTPPNQLFLATELASGTFRPLEFSWPFATDLANPQAAGIMEQPDTRIYENNTQKPVFPTIYSAVTIEETLFRTLQPSVVHVWTLPSILPNHAEKGTSDAVFYGFVHLYFPYFKSMPPIGRPEKDAAKTLSEFREMVDKRLAKMESGVKSSVVQKAKNPVLTELYIFKCILPPAPELVTALELSFYEMTPTPQKPFIRFFPAKDRTPALIKVATNEDGVMLIRNERLLDALMSEKPSTETGAVLLIKLPIDHPKAPLGTCWTLRMYENGHAEMYIGAPRRDAPLPSAVIFLAMNMVSTLLQDTPWAEKREGIQLCELTAEYELVSGLETGKPGKTELANRLDPFIPLFSVDPPVDTEKAAIALRYKGVSNYVATTNPLMNYLTALYLNRSARSTAEVPKGAYVDALRKEFGISLLEAKAAEEEWIERHSSYVTTYKSEGGELRIKDLAIRDAKCGAEKYQSDEDTTIAAYNTGASVTIFNEHPKYRMLIAGVESVMDLRRILVLMTLFINKNAEELKVAKTPETAAEAVIETVTMAAPPPVIPEELAAGWDQLFSGMMEEYTEMGPVEPQRGPEAPVAETEGPAVPESAAAAAATAAATEADVAMPTEVAPDEKLPPISKEWYLNNLKSRDKDLFQYTKTSEERVKLYSRQCQLAQHRQPNVLAPDAYRRAKILYGDNVIWLEAPPSKEIQKALLLASKTAGQRKGPKADVVEMEILALSNGFPLKGNKSVSDGDKSISKEKKDQIARMMVEQQNKPLWVVVKTGTDSAHINYYLCAEYWCIRDDLPLIGKVFKGTIGHDGRPKEQNSCPFCRGRLIADKEKPAIGETVIEREKTATSDKIAQYAGFLSGLFHPDSYPLPCCFTDPKSLEPPADSRMPSSDDADAAAEAPEEPIPAVAPAPALAPENENRSRPFSPMNKNTNAQNRWYIPNQNILGRIKQDWFDIEKGSVAVPPGSVNQFLGQNPETFLTKNKGIGAEKINSYLGANTHAFVRYGLGHNPRALGTSLLSLIAWANYATQQLRGSSEEIAIPSDDAILERFNDDMFGIGMARAFEQANYGSLIHEFASSKTEFVTTGHLQDWCKRMGGLNPSSIYVKKFYAAWMRFKAYVNDLKQPKDLRLWEMLFSVPGLLTSTGCILVRIQVPKNKTDAPTLFCPQFGISLHDQAVPPPFLFLLEDAFTGNYDAMVLYEGRDGKKQLFGAIQPEAAEMQYLSPEIRAALRTFSADYLSMRVGCGRSVPPVHPWLPVRDAKFIPRLSDFADRAVKLLRERSNRLVGVIVPKGSASIYIPCVDDGLILPNLSSVYGEESLPQPDIKDLFEIYIQNNEGPLDPKGGCEPENAIHEGLLPVKLRKRGDKYVAVELRCGAIVSVKPFAIRNAKNKINNPCYVAMLERQQLPLEDGDAPWEVDKVIIGPTKANPLELATKEEELEEAYQYLRISFSNWLLTPEGIEMARAIDDLRAARRRLPLWELQKRLDLLLYPVVSQWIDTKTRPPSKPSILRRDCLQIKTESQCTQGCSWQPTGTEDEQQAPSRPCLIHTTATERYVDPVHLMSARLTDELLRTFGKAMEVLHQAVPRLKPLDVNELVYEDNSLLFSAIGRGSKSLYDMLGYSERQPTMYTTGLTYPEEVGIDAATMDLPADWTTALRRIVGNAEIRDPAVILNLIIHSMTGKEQTFRGTNAEWQQIAEELNVNILKTQYNSEKHAIDVYEQILNPTYRTNLPSQYIVLDVDGVPLQNVQTAQFTIREDMLPASILAWKS
jgi:hypothetical protein